MKAFFLFFTLFFAFSWAYAQEVLVQSLPVYEVGDSFSVNFPTEVGNLDISAVATDEVRKGRRQGLYTEFRVILSLNGVKIFEGIGYGSKEISNAYMMYQGMMYRAMSTMPFPLRDGATFTNKILATGPCAQYRGKTCLNVLMSENCYGTRRVYNGIEFICSGAPGGRIRYIVDENLLPVEYEKLQ